MPAGKCQCGKCSCGDGRIRPSSRAKRGAARLFENCPSPLYKSQDGPRARHPSNSRPHSPTPRPHHNRRRPAPSRSSRGSPLHQPPSIPKPGSHGSSSGDRTSRPPTATPPPPRSSFRPRFRPRPRRAIVVRARFPGTRAPLRLNAAGVVFAIAAVFADVLHLNPALILITALAAVISFGISGVIVLNALRKPRP